MTLGFSTKWPDRMGELAGQPNYFVEKVWNELTYTGSPYIHKPMMDISWNIHNNNHITKFGKQWDMPDNPVYAKPHTIREDPSNRWRVGMDIHFVIYNRTKNRFQFAPVIKCVSTQEIKIIWTPYNTRPLEVQIDNKWFNPYGRSIKRLAINDGFPSVEAFFQYFDKNFYGKIIHWTDLRY